MDNQFMLMATVLSQELMQVTDPLESQLELLVTNHNTALIAMEGRMKQTFLDEILKVTQQLNPEKPIDHSALGAAYSSNRGPQRPLGK